jgi:L-asparaginase II
MNRGQLLIEVIRGPLVESRHCGHIAVVDTNQNLVAYAGDPAHYSFARSTAKLLQAIPLIEAGGAERYGLDDQQIALICASHNGEDEHADVANRTLHQLGLDETSLRCGVHEPFDASTANRLRKAGIAPTPLRNNCSGKHTGMLAFTQMLDASTETYVSVEHPVQQHMLKVVAEMSGVSQEEITLGTDGCGVPVFALPLDALAYAYARLGRPDDLPKTRADACRRIIHAIAHEPFYVAGSGRFDTRLIQATKGRIIGKFGAEGLFTLTVPQQGWGLAMKIEDGAQRALYPAVMEALIQLDALLDHEIKELSDFHRPSIMNCHQTIVGEIRPAFTLIRPI